MTATKSVAAGTHPEDGSTLTIDTFDDLTTQFLNYHLGAEAAKRAAFQGVEFDGSEWPLPLAEYDPTGRVLKTFPTFLDPATKVFTQPKYRNIKAISFENQDPLHKPDGFDMIFDLPTGFVRTPFGGFGVDPRIKYIVQALDDLPGVTGITICTDAEISIDGPEVRLPEALYHDVRLNINRAHDAAVNFANGEKLAYLRSRLLPPIVPGYAGDEYERPAIDLQETVRAALAKRGTPRQRNSNTSGAVRTVIRSAEEIAKTDPVQMFELSQKIELVSLELLIDSMSTNMQSAHREDYWQAFFRDNPFVLKILFGLPVILYASQASVGGMGLQRSGEKYADYLLEAGMLGNLAIVEIKTTESALMTRDPYRPPALYGPSTELAGGVSQLLDQRLKLITNIASKKVEDDSFHIQAWAVPCILVIGRNPSEKPLMRSFELYRGNQRDVLIITFDELLAKLKALHEFLVTKPAGSLP